MSTESILFLDTFSAGHLSPTYRIFDEGIADTVSLTGGWLRIEAHSKQDLWNGGSKKGAPLVLRSAPDGDYWAETFVNAGRIGQPNQPVNTQVGLFVFQDVRNWLFFGLTHHSFGSHAGDGLMVTKTEGGGSSPMPVAGGDADPEYPTRPLKQDAVYLRVARHGDDWRFYWKLQRDGAWNLVATVPLALGDHEVGMGIKTFDLDASPNMLPPGAAHFDFFAIGRGAAGGDRGLFEHAVKFVCGRSEGEVVAPGAYWTAINVHNPSTGIAGLRYKVAVAPPGGEPGPVSKFREARLGPDEALEIDCPDIFRLADLPDHFLKGFVVIQCAVELDVVAVYTAAGAQDMVETFHTERVSPRRVELGLPDLIPVPDENGFFCRLRDGTLIVTVKNQGTAEAGPSVTEVDFFAHGKATNPTPALAPGASVDLAFPIPPNCFDPDCAFRITVDANRDVAELDEGNNVASGMCLG